MLTEARPHYRRPPVVEVVCGVQFSGAEGWATPHFGRFWQQVEAQYPQFEDQPPLPLLRLDGQSSSEPQLFSMPPMRRVFFVQPPGNFLMQVQKNRLLHNWRKVDESDEYPRFEMAYERFVSAWDSLGSFLATASLPPAHADVLELTYVNQITRAGAKFPRDVWEFLAFYARTPKAVTAKESTALAMQFGWPLPSEMGTLALDLKHGLRANDESEVLMIELSARGKAKEEPGYMSAWFDAAHRAIVNTFDDFTTDDAHTLWEKYEA
jgi:uncharacterized protein (TIGR04255 family)